jgi:hypothetical protein
MQTDFVKRRDREFEAQVAQFLANLGPVKTALGLPANWEAQLQTRKNSFTTALNSLDLAEAAYRQAKQTKDAARRSLVGERPATRCYIPMGYTPLRGELNEPAWCCSGTHD